MSQALCHSELHGSGPLLFCLPLPFKRRRHRVRSNPLSAARAVGGGATCTYFSYSESDEGMEGSTITKFGLLLLPRVRTFLPPRSKSSDFAEISFWISSSEFVWLLTPFPPFYRRATLSSLVLGFRQKRRRGSRDAAISLQQRASQPVIPFSSPAPLQPCIVAANSIQQGLSDPSHQKENRAVHCRLLFCCLAAWLTSCVANCSA